MGEFDNRHGHGDEWVCSECIREEAAEYSAERFMRGILYGFLFSSIFWALFIIAMVGVWLYV